MPRERLELSQTEVYSDLNAACLPVPPPRHVAVALQSSHPHKCGCCDFRATAPFVFTLNPSGPSVKIDL